MPRRLIFPNQLGCPINGAAKPSKYLDSLLMTVYRNHSNFAEDVRFSNSSGSHWSSLSDPLAKWRREGFHDATYILNKLISFCAKFDSFSSGLQLHSTAIKLGLSSNFYVSNPLMKLYSIRSAQKLFDEMPLRNVVSWNSLMTAYLDHGQYEIALGLFLDMIRDGISPTQFSISAVLVGCSELRAENLGDLVQGLSLKTGYFHDVVVGTGLIIFHYKCMKLEDSNRVFVQMPERNLLTWIAMVSGYALNQNPDKAMILFIEMQRFGLVPNYVAYNNLLRSFYSADYFFQCQQVHCLVIKDGFLSNPYLEVTLLTVYSECSNNLKDFWRICSGIVRWNQVSLNAVIGGFSNLGDGKVALEYFTKMRRAGIEMDYFTYSSVLKGMGNVSALVEGSHTHALVLKSGYASDVCIQNGLVTMYAKCGLICESKKVFLSMVEQDVISWNSLLGACSSHGNGMEVINLFEEMRNRGVKPDNMTFLIVLSACSHVGMIDKGLEYFELMKEYTLPESLCIEHYACMVDLYGRAGYLYEAEALINTMAVEPGRSVYKSLLSACRVHGNTEIAVRAASKLLEYWPNDPATYVLLSNVFAAGENWDNVACLRKFMQEKGVLKELAFTWV